MVKKNKKEELSTEQKVAIGVGLTAAAVAAAGAYFLQGSPEAKKNRRKVKSWMLKAKAEVLETLEKAEEMTAEEFEHVVAGVTTTYSTLKDASKADIADFKREMRDHWPKIVQEGKSITRTVTKITKKPVKKAAKKATKKTTKKNTKKAAKKAVKKTTKKTAKK